MDSYQGSTPLNFIPSRLENLLKENAPAPTTSQVSNPAVVENLAATSEGTPQDRISIQVPQPEELVKHCSPALSQDSDADVTAHAESVVQRMQQVRTHTVQDSSLSQSAPPQGQESGNVPPELIPATLENRRSSTPIQSEGEERQEADLSALESVLKVIMSSESQLPKLRDRDYSGKADVSGTRSRTDEDNASSVCHVPALPGGAPKERFTVSQNEEEESTEESSRLVPVELYGYPPFAPESGTEGEGETSSERQPLGPSKERATSGNLNQDGLPDLSGHSRAILKEYFEEASPIRLPIGHTTVAFTEPQVYHLLRTLTDETLRRSFTTMERMVLDAVRGSPKALPSRTAHFQLRGRSQTPSRRALSESETDSDRPGSAMNPLGSGIDDTGGSSFYEESDSATEMVLISKSFKRTPALPLGSETQEMVITTQQQTGLEAEGFSSQDTLEMREQAQKGLGEGPSASKKNKGNKRLTRRGVLMREEFFSKIGWTRSFISGPADPLHNPHMVWCHICKKNFSIMSKGPYENLRHHRTDRHSRRDQRWRYEHLRSTDPVNGKVQHRVRGANCKILTKIELANQLPKFINVELVDIGERFPFYEDFIRGTTTALVAQEARVKTQLCLVSDFIKTIGDLSVPRNLWSRMGAYTIHQATVCDFDWGEERITVSFLSMTLSQT